MSYQKTLAMKVLDGKKIPYEVFPYPADLRDAEVIADLLGVPPRQLFKTLVVLPPGTVGRAAKPLLVIVPADCQLDLKKLAKLVDAKKVQLASHKEAEALTGLQVGGISALALLNKGFVIYLDANARQFDAIYISAGQKGLDVKLAVADLLGLTAVTVADVVTD